MAKIPIWPGSASFSSGKTPFGFYDADSNFQSDAPSVAKWCAQRLCYPLVDIELQDVNFFSAFEEAVTEYGHQLYTFQIINNLFRIKGNATGSNLNQIYLDDYYGTSIAQGQGSMGSSGYTSGEQRLYSASLKVIQGRQKYNLLSSEPELASATVTFNGEVAESGSITITDHLGSVVEFKAFHNEIPSGEESNSDYIWPGISSSISSSANEFSASSAAISSNSFFEAIRSGSFSATISATLDTGSNEVTLTQNTEGTAGNTSITSNLTNVTASAFTGGTSGLDFEQSGSAIQSGVKQIKIKKIYHYQPAAINRYFDPYAGTGTGIQSLMQTFGFGNYSPGVNFMLMPMYFDALKIQAIELNDTIRKSAYHFELNAGKYLKLFPIPTSNYTLWFEYTMADSAISPALQESADGETEEEKPKNLITDISNAPYTQPIYEYINEPGRQWIRKYTLALAKEMLGGIRGKYQSLPIPGSDTTLDYSRLLSEAVAEKAALIEQLREDLEATTTLRQAERRTLESEQTQQQYTVNNPYQIYIH